MPPTLGGPVAAWVVPQRTSQTTDLDLAGPLTLSPALTDVITSLQLVQLACPARFI